ncbi:hypothetical protein BKA70DRAFT_336537 [Coprinopsis sp. MPI-PUGE-AT-0042]|nr:hypothetical protein BKA70DRAFT_336537 [Coprinopsis sp. MPI-PUGE-AT-0042]
MPWTAGTQMVLSMSDATDVTAGGITDLLTLGPAGGATCDTTVQRVDFFFSLDGALQQCGDFPVTNYGGATRPVSLFGFIPNGGHFAIEGVQEESFNWKVAQPAGTTILFYMTDAEQRNGGVALRSVGSSGDSGCLPVAQPSSSLPPSTPGVRPSSGSGTSRKPASTGGADDDTYTGDQGKEEKKGSNIGLIVGAAAGGFVALGLFAFAAVFCFKRKKRQTNPTSEVKIDIDGAPPGPFKSPSNTYLLPSSYNGSNANLAPSQSAAPYAQQSLQSNASYAQQSFQSGPSYGAPVGHASLHARPSYQPTTPTTTGGPPSDYNPYAANEMGAYGHSAQHSISNASGVSPYGGVGSGQSVTSAGYPPSSGYGTGASAVAAAAAGAGAYGAYNQYQQHQHQAPNHQQYPPSSTQQYNVGPQGPLFATNADPPSSPYTATAGGSKPNHKPSGSTDKRAPPVQASQQRVIQHQDIEESIDLPEELPPQYSERRAPIPGLPSSHAGGSHNPDRKS